MRAVAHGVVVDCGDDEIVRQGGADEHAGTADQDGAMRKVRQ